MNMCATVNASAGGAYSADPSPIRLPEESDYAVTPQQGDAATIGSRQGGSGGRSAGVCGCWVPDWEFGDRTGILTCLNGCLPGVTDTRYPCFLAVIGGS